jgi:M6 family metalloprotease-like protein
MPPAEGAAKGNRATARRLPTIRKNWDAGKTYKQIVILFSFRDVDFKSEDPNAYYNRLFNEKGYHERSGYGCVADYYRDQSNGLLNLEFDIYGPVKVDTLAQPYENPTANTKNYGRPQMRDATQQVIAANPDVDYSQYDWNGDGYVDQVIYVYAGVAGNTGAYGHIWPNTSSFSTIKAPDGTRFNDYTSSSELLGGTVSAGIGTICHEFTHSLGLPDIYPTSNDAGYSTCDEWDLMDGGNFVNYGWCPPNFTPLEKMLLGWLTPKELTEPATVTDLKPLAEGGEVYQVKHTDKEYLLIENRQQTGWDAGVPGQGLVIWHVNYDASAWSGNYVNNKKGEPRFDIVHADNMDYAQWEAYIGRAKHKNKAYMNSYLLSTSPYPWATDSTTFVNTELTDTSIPAAEMYTTNAEGSKLLGKPITNIRMSEDGLVSFDFMGGAAPAIKGDLNGDGIVNALDIQLEINACVAGASEAVYDLNEDGIVNALDIQTVINIAALSASND